MSIFFSSRIINRAWARLESITHIAIIYDFSPPIFSPLIYTIHTRHEDSFERCCLRKKFDTCSRASQYCFLLLSLFLSFIFIFEELARVDTHNCYTTWCARDDRCWEKCLSWLVKLSQCNSRYMYTLLSKRIHSQCVRYIKYLIYTRKATQQSLCFYSVLYTMRHFLPRYIARTRNLLFFTTNREANRNRPARTFEESCEIAHLIRVLPISSSVL